MQLKIIYSLLFLLFSTVLLAQSDNGYTLHGTVIDAENNTELPLVNIFNISEQTGTTTDRKGNFSLRLDSLPALIQCTYIGYETLALRIDEPDNQRLIIKLQASVTKLPDIIVSAKPIIESITKPVYTVRDYVFYEGKILLATLPGISKGNSLVLIDEAGNALDSFSIKGIRRFDFLHKSCTDKIHLVTETNDYEIAIDTTGVRIAYDSPRKDFDKYIEPCVSSTDSLLIFAYRFYIGQMLRFFGYDKTTKEKLLIAEVANDENLERRYWEELASSVGYIDLLDISWEEKQRELKKVMINDMKLAGLIRLFYKPIDIPVLNISQQIVIFNHLSGHLHFFNETGQPTNTVPVSYQKEKKWDKKIIFDEITEDVYTLFDHPKGKLVRKININDGTLGSPLLIDCGLVEKMKIHNGHLYFLESGRGLGGYNRVLKKVKI